jgi:hypothetical protein
MWKDLIEFTKAVFSLQSDTQQNKDDIKKYERNIEILQQETLRIFAKNLPNSQPSLKDLHLKFSVSAIEKKVNAKKWLYNSKTKC